MAWLICADYDGKEDSSVPLEKVLDCIPSCIHVAYIDDILEKKNNLEHLCIASLSPELSWTGTFIAKFFLGKCSMESVSINRFIMQSKYRLFYQLRDSAQGFMTFCLILR